jgi:putative FmdB family regulatory protein
MPTYQYRCVDCGSELEAVQKFTDASLTECPECDGSLRKVYSAVGVVFKGSGFYATDNRTKGKAAAAAGSSGEKSSSSEKPSGSDKSSSSEKPSSGSDSASSPAKSSTTSAA